MNRDRRRGAVLAALSMVVLVFGAMGLVMALSHQADQTRSVHASLAQGRLATELAESALAETLAEFGTVLSGLAGSGDHRSRLAGAAEAGRVPGPKVFDLEVFEYDPLRTRDLLEEGRGGVELSPVLLRPLYYGLMANLGEMELSCTASLALVGGRKLVRRVTAVHSFALQPDGRSFRIVPVPLRVMVDRRPKL